MNFSRNRRTLMGLSFDGETLTSDLRNALAYGSKWNNCVFVDCHMGKADFNAATFTGCIFNRCDLDQATFRSAIIKNCQFINGRAEYTDFWNATLTGVKFEIQLHGADLRYASAVDVDYGSSNLWGVSINVNCNTFAGQAYSERSIRVMLALLARSLGNEALTAEMERLAGVDAIEMVKKLTRKDEECATS